MDLSEAARLARSLVNEHGVGSWTFQYDRAKRRFGACHHSRKMITLSESIVRLNPESEVRNTILHEIAHALAGPGAHHGPAWVRIARSIGCDARRCHTAETPEHSWVASCPNCHTEIKRHRRGPRLGCRRCKERTGEFFYFVWRAA